MYVWGSPPFGHGGVAFKDFVECLSLECPEHLRYVI